MSAKGSSLRQLRRDGWKILGELTSGKDTAQAIEAAKPWACDLVMAVEPVSEVWAIRLGTIGHIKGGEDIFARRYVSKVTDKRHRAAITRHAVRLCRLEKLLDEIKGGTVAGPKNKGGRPKDEHPELVKAVQLELWAQDERGEKRNKANAYRLALEPLELDGNEYEALTSWLEKQEWLPATPRKTGFSDKK